MARGATEQAWQRSKMTAEAIRSCWVKERLPAAFMAPFYRDNIPQNVKWMLVMDAMRARYAKD